MQFYDRYEIKEELEIKWWRALSVDDYALYSDWDTRFRYISRSSGMQEVENDLRAKGLGTVASHNLLVPNSEQFLNAAVFSFYQ